MTPIPQRWRLPRPACTTRQVDWPRCPRAVEHLPEVRPPDPNRSPNPDGAQIAARDPRPDSLRMDTQTLRHIADRQELAVRRHGSVAATG